MTRREHGERAARCGEQARDAMGSVATLSADLREGRAASERTIEYKEGQAVRMAKLAAFHAFMMRPTLRAPNNYDIAVREHRARQRAGGRR